MLSEELKHSHSGHLNELMQKINAPHTLEVGTQEAKTFRKSVVDRLERRTLTDEISDSTIQLFGSTKKKCSSCCRKKKSSLQSLDKETEVMWRRRECKTMESFEAMIGASISANLNCIRCLKAICQSLSFWEEAHPNWEGLSIIGSYMWLLSFSVQHLLDYENPKAKRPVEVEEIRHKFQEIAQSAEIFAEMINKFHEHTHRLRTDALQTVKRIVKKWKLEQESPLLKRPEKVITIYKEPKRRLGKGLGDLQDENELIGETVFHLNWTPLTVMLRSKEISWTEFASLNQLEKYHWFGIFVQRTLDILELSAEDLTMVTGQISSISIDGNNPEAKSHARELSGALLSFAKSGPSPKKPKKEEKLKMIEMISEYWYSIDILHEESYKLLRLVHETRDIVRTCYVYMDTFYKWELPSYDQFLTNDEYKRSKDSSQTIANIREVWGKSTSREGADRKLSDISEMLVMMDFSTSAYQNILENRPIQADGMFMKLSSVTFEDDQEYGLVSGCDVRKSNKDK